MEKPILNNKTIIKKDHEVSKVDGEIVSEKRILIVEDNITKGIEKFVEIDTKTGSRGLPLDNKAARCSCCGKLVRITNFSFCRKCGIIICRECEYSLANDSGDIAPICERCAEILAPIVQKCNRDEKKGLLETGQGDFEQKYLPPSNESKENIIPDKNKKENKDM